MKLALTLVAIALLAACGSRENDRLSLPRDHWGCALYARANPVGSYAPPHCVSWVDLDWLAHQ